MLEEYFEYKPDEETSEFLDGLSFHEFHLHFFLVDSDSVDVVLHFLGTLEDAEKLREKIIDDLVNVGEFSYVFNPYAAKMFNVRKTIFKPRGVSVALTRHIRYGLDLIPLKDAEDSVHLALPFDAGFAQTYFERGVFLRTANEEVEFLSSHSILHTREFNLNTEDLIRKVFQEYSPGKSLVYKLDTPISLDLSVHQDIYSLPIPRGVLFARSIYWHPGVDDLIGVSVKP